MNKLPFPAGFLGGCPYSTHFFWAPRSFIFLAPRFGMIYEELLLDGWIPTPAVLDSIPCSIEVEKFCKSYIYICSIWASAGILSINGMTMTIYRRSKALHGFPCKPDWEPSRKAKDNGSRVVNLGGGIGTKDGLNITSVAEKWVFSVKLCVSPGCDSIKFRVGLK